MTHLQNYKIHGDDIQAIEFTLEPGNGLKAEAGALLFSQTGIQMDTKFEGGIGGVLKRMFTNESLAIPYFHNTSNQTQAIAFAAPYPGKIIPLDLNKFNGRLLCQRDSYLCSDMDTNISIAFTKKLGAGFVGGEGFILQKIEGQGHVFIHSGGAILQRELQQGEELKVDTGCLVAFSDTIDYDIKWVGGFKNMFFGGEGFFQTLLKGPGTVYLQSLPFSRIAARVLESATGTGAGTSESGGTLGQLFNKVLDGQ